MNLSPTSISIRTGSCCHRRLSIAEEKGREETVKNKSKKVMTKAIAFYRGCLQPSFPSGIQPLNC